MISLFEHHRIHPNSIAAWRQLDIRGRVAVVCEALEKIGHPSTDRDVCRHLGQSDMNYVRPAITRLVDSRVLTETDTVRCPVTNRLVRRVWFANTEVPCDH